MMKERKEEELDVLDTGYPLLVDYKDKALGSYTHSKNVSNILGSIAEKMGYNSRLLRIAGMYHDIGKKESPLVFSENQPDATNMHDDLHPSVSFALIKAHVAHTVQILFNDANISDEVIAVCSQHHGNTLAKFFADKDTDANPEEYRYTGKIPQTVSAMLLMLCDHLEARIRAELNSGRMKSIEEIAALIEKVFDQLVDDGQLDDVVISIKELRDIKLLLNSEFSELFSDHKRIDYEESAQAGNS